jgi:hypothetical protein
MRYARLSAPVDGAGILVERKVHAHPIVIDGVIRQQISIRQLGEMFLSWYRGDSVGSASFAVKANLPVLPRHWPMLLVSSSVSLG